MKRRYRNLKQAFFIGLVAVVGFSGCKKFLAVNDNPNNPDHADPRTLLPTTETAISQVIGNSFQVFGNIWSQYWTQAPTSSQYKSIDQYAPVNTDFNGPWLNLYTVTLINADLITKSTGVGLENEKGIAYVIKAYAYQVATDAFGDVPLTQALQSTGNLNPKYDKQQVVYDSIFMYIDKAMPLLAANSVSPGSQDMIFNGDMNQWIAFANTLKLRAYLRLSNVDPATAQAGIAALYQTKPTFLTEDATITYTTTGGNENPFYNEMTSPVLNYVQNVVASSTAVAAFKNNNDPRLAKFYTLLPNDPDNGTAESIPQGSYISYPGTLVSPPSPVVGGEADDPASAKAPVKLISAAESYFLQAEAVARTWAPGDATDVTTLYKEGIQASFTATGAGDATTYMASAKDGLKALATNKIKAIITQKYYAMCGFQGFEAWNEWRRTGYPDFLIQSQASTIDPGKMPLRMLYPNSELTSNLHYPGTVPITTPVWWGISNP